MKTRILFLLSLLFFFKGVSAQSLDGNGWRWQYPKPQGNALNDIYIFDQETAIAVGDFGTVIKTTDGGTSWDVQHHAGGSACNLSSVHFIDSKNGWAAGRNRDLKTKILVKTSDGGKSWSKIDISSTLAFNAVHFVNADTGFVVGEDGLLARTTDGGISWDVRKIDDYIGRYLDVFDLFSITFTDERTGWIVGYGYDGNQIYKTTDCGATWQWSDIIRPIVFSEFRDIYFTDKNHGFITGAYFFLKTTDGGASWNYLNLMKIFQEAEYQQLYSIYFADSLTGWIVGGAYFSSRLKTTDGGQNWTKQIDSGTTGMLYKIRLSNSAFNRAGWIVGQFGRIYRTTDGGSNWTTQNEKQYNFRSVHFVNESKGWVAGDSGMILNTIDGGGHWQKQNIADSLILNSIFAADTQHVFAVGTILGGIPAKAQKAILLRTIDGGLNWTSKTFDSLLLFKSVAFVNDSIGWIAGTAGTLLKTTNKGDKWIRILSDTNSTNTTLGKIRFIDQYTGWVGSTLKTTDAGQSWKTTTIPSLSLPSTFFVNINVGWIVGELYGGPNIFKTTDGGTTWSPSGNTFSGYGFSIFFADENNGWTTGTNLRDEHTMIKTTDGGASWFGQDIPSSALSDLYFVNKNTGWAVGDGIFKTTNGGGIVSVGASTTLRSNAPERLQLYQNYPNPFNPSTVIKYQLSKSGMVSLRVYDILGRLVSTMVDNWEQAGEHSRSWEANHFSSGVYFYVLRTGEFSESKKMILIH